MDSFRDAFHRYLTNNDAPSAQEASQFHGVLNIVYASNAHHRSMVHTTEAHMKQLRAVLSPLRLFPAEVLGEIFVHTLDVPRFLDTKGRTNLLNLGLVCKKWRDATLATPKLWANISVGGREMNVSKVLMWFERARGTPKSLCLQRELEDHHKSSSSFLWDLEDSNLAGVYHVRLEAKDAEELKEACFMWKVAAEARAVASGRSLFRGELRSFEAYFTDDIEQGDGWQWNGIARYADNPRYSWPFDDIPPVTSLSLRFPTEDLAFKPPPDSDDGEDEDEWEPVVLLNLVFPTPLLQSLTSLNIVCDWEGNHIYNLLAKCPNLETLTCTPTLALEDFAPLAVRHLDLVARTRA